MTKTTESLMIRIAEAKASGKSSVDLSGMRECTAAKKLAEQGIGSFQNLGGMSGGDYYIHPFTRRPATTKFKYVASGVFHIA